MNKRYIVIRYNLDGSCPVLGCPNEVPSGHFYCSDRCARVAQRAGYRAPAQNRHPLERALRQCRARGNRSHVA